MVDTTACDIIISITKKTLKEGESGKVIIKKSLPPPKNI